MFRLTVASNQTNTLTFLNQIYSYLREHASFSYNNRLTCMIYSRANAVKRNKIRILPYTVSNYLIIVTSALRDSVEVTNKIFFVRIVPSDRKFYKFV